MSKERLRDFLAPYLAEGPQPWETVIPGGAGAIGKIVQWTCDKPMRGIVITHASQLAPDAIDVDQDGAPHIGHTVRCLYVSESVDYGPLARVVCLEQDCHGKRLYVYVRDCCFD